MAPYSSSTRDHELIKKKRGYLDPGRAAELVDARAHCCK